MASSGASRLWPDTGSLLPSADSIPKPLHSASGEALRRAPRRRRPPEVAAAPLPVSRSSARRGTRSVCSVSGLVVSCRGVPPSASMIQMCQRPSAASRIEGDPTTVRRPVRRALPAAGAVGQLVRRRTRPPRPPRPRPPRPSGRNRRRCDDRPGRTRAAKSANDDTITGCEARPRSNR